MTNREKLLNYVKNGGDRFLCSPQIGAGAGFDAKLSGKAWLSEVTPADTKSAVERFDIVPLYNFGLPDLARNAGGVTVETDQAWDGAKKCRRTETRFITPAGTLAQTLVEEEFKGPVATKYFITDEEELDVLAYYLDALLEAADYSFVSEHIRDLRKVIGEDAALDIQWATQPYELFGFPNTVDTALFFKLCPDVCAGLMDKILKLDEILIRAAAEGGTDFVFLGGPGSEMISPQYYEDFLVPYSRTVSQMAHANGLLIYSHICSPIEPMLTMGYYNQMGIDLFETLSEAPVGNVKSLEDAFAKLSPEICTRGNVGLDVLLEAAPEEVREAGRRILETARRMGRKHILAASDYLFYDVPEENVRALAEAAAEANAAR
jgi:uroporphyrinogen-III decarboxylase